MPPVLFISALASDIRPFSVCMLCASALPKSLCCCSLVSTLYDMATALNALTSSFTLSLPLVALVAILPKARAASTFFCVNLPNSLPASDAILVMSDNDLAVSRSLLSYWVVSNLNLVITSAISYTNSCAIILSISTCNCSAAFSSARCEACPNQLREAIRPLLPPFTAPRRLCDVPSESV